MKIRLKPPVHAGVRKKREFMGLAKGVQDAFISIYQREERRSLVDGKFEELIFASSTSPFPFVLLSFPLAPIVLLPGLRRGDDFVGIR